MLILLGYCHEDPIKSEDGKSIDLNSWLVKNRITPRKRNGPRSAPTSPKYKSPKQKARDCSRASGLWYHCLACAGCGYSTWAKNARATSSRSKVRSNVIQRM
jgi:hypothetical protein